MIWRMIALIWFVSPMGHAGPLPRAETEAPQIATLEFRSRATVGQSQTQYSLQSVAFARDSVALIYVQKVARRADELGHLSPVAVRAGEFAASRLEVPQSLARGAARSKTNAADVENALQPRADLLGPNGSMLRPLNGLMLNVQPHDWQRKDGNGPGVGLARIRQSDQGHALIFHSFGYADGCGGQFKLVVGLNF